MFRVLHSGAHAPWSHALRFDDDAIAVQIVDVDVKSHEMGMDLIGISQQKRIVPCMAHPDASVLKAPSHESKKPTDKRFCIIDMHVLTAPAV